MLQHIHNDNANIPSAGVICANAFHSKLQIHLMLVLEERLGVHQTH